MLNLPSAFRPTVFGPPSMFSGVIQAATGVESSWCLSFPSTGKCVTLGSPISLTGQFSISFWVKSLNVTTGWRTLIAFGTGIGDGIFIKSGSSLLYFEYVTGSNTFGTVGDGSWHHVVITRNGSNVIRAWIDGTQHSNAPTRSGTITLGYLSSPKAGEHADSLIDDVRVWNGTVITPTEIGYLANNTQNVTTGLAAYLDMEEGTGTTTAVKDGTGATIATATLNNGPTWHPQTPPKLVSGRETLTHSLSFDGSNDSVSIPDSSFPTASGSPFSVSAWVYVSSTTGFPMILCKGAVNSAWLLFLDASTKQIYLRVIGATFAATGANHIVTPSNAIASNTWHHVAIVWTCTSATIYVNGVAVATSSATDTNQSWGSSNLYFASAASSNYMAGRLCNSGFYSRALSPTDIARLARGQRPTVDDPVGRWKLNEGSGTTAIDSGSGGNNGTLTNGPTYSTDVPPWLSA